MAQSERVEALELLIFLISMQFQTLLQEEDELPIVIPLGFGGRQLFRISSRMSRIYLRDEGC
ncbi:hypothetical protein D3C76_1783240 [compost metagenome]